MEIHDCFTSHEGCIILTNWKLVKLLYVLHEFFPKYEQIYYEQKRFFHSVMQPKRLRSQTHITVLAEEEQMNGKQGKDIGWE